MSSRKVGARRSGHEPGNGSPCAPRRAFSRPAPSLSGRTPPERGRNRRRLGFSGARAGRRRVARVAKSGRRARARPRARGFEGGARGAQDRSLRSRARSLSAVKARHGALMARARAERGPQERDRREGGPPAGWVLTTRNLLTRFGISAINITIGEIEPASLAGRRAARRDENEPARFRLQPEIEERTFLFFSAATH